MVFGLLDLPGYATINVRYVIINVVGLSLISMELASKTMMSYNAN